MLLLFVALVGCSGDQAPPRGELMVALITDMSVPKDVTHIRVKVKLGNEVRHEQEFLIAPDGELHLPGTIAVVEGSTPNPVVSVDVIGIRTPASGKAEARTFAKVTTTIPRERIALLRIPVQWLCDGSAVDDGTGSYTSSCAPIDGQEAACISGRCLPVETDSNSLATFEPEEVFGGGTTPSDPLAVCFDTLGCFDRGKDVARSKLGTGCTLEVPDDGSSYNVALRLPKGGDGICHSDAEGGACYVPLDQDELLGWRFATDPPEGKRVLQLPPAVCDRLSAGTIQAVRVSSACETKTPAHPTCGPWAAIPESHGSEAGSPSGTGGASAIDGDANGGAPNAGGSGNVETAGGGTGGGGAGGNGGASTDEGGSGGAAGSGEYAGASSAGEAGAGGEAPSIGGSGGVGESVDLRLFPTPITSHLEAITSGPDGNLWFTATVAGQIGRITPTGTVTMFSLPTAQAGPQGITLGPDNNLWFTEKDGNAIGKITTAGVVTEFPLPQPASSPGGIAPGPDGALWFTERTNVTIGRITTAGSITRFPVSNTTDPLPAPDQITQGPDGNLWFTAGDGVPVIGRMTPTGTVTSFYLGGKTPTIGITQGPDGNLWCTTRSLGVYRVTPTGTSTNFVGGSNLDSGITSGPDGNLWLGSSLSSGRGLARLTPTGALTEWPVDFASTGGIWGITVGPDAKIWFTTDKGVIGRATPP